MNLNDPNLPPDSGDVAGGKAGKRAWSEDSPDSKRRGNAEDSTREPEANNNDDSVTVVRSTRRKSDAQVNALSGQSHLNDESTQAHIPGKANQHSAIRPGSDSTDPNTEQNDDSEITVVSRKPPQSVPGHVSSSQQLGELLIGKQLGTFRLEKFLGSGGMGAVFQATDTQLHRQVAVKVLKNSEGDPDAIRRFRTEAQSAARLDHENIARVYHVGQDKGWNYIVLELVEGRTLRQLVLDSGPLAYPLTINYFRQLAGALQHAHHRKIIHRDIKPSNVLITPDQKVKIVDMGLARIITPEKQGDETEDGMTLGTFDYIAPEQARDPRSADEQSDLYSLGCTLFYALTGRAPFAGGNAIEKILNHNTAARPNVCDFRPDLPAEANLLVTRLMAPNKLDRIQSADELGQALQYLQQPRTRRVETSRVAPLSPRVPMLMVVAASLVFFLSLLFDGPLTDNRVEFPAIPGKLVDAETPNPNPGVSNPDSNITVPPVEAGATKTGEPTAIDPTYQLKKFTDIALNPEPEKFRMIPDANAAQPQPDSPLASKLQTTRIWDNDKSPFATDNLNELPARPSYLELGSTTEFLSSNNSDMEKQLDGNVRPEMNPSSFEKDANSESLSSTIQVRPASQTLDGNKQGLPSRPNVMVVETLDQALASLKNRPHVHTIELCFDSVQDCNAVQLPGSFRILKAADGYHPTIRFRATSNLSRSSFLTVIGGELSLQGIDFVMDTRSADRPFSLLQFPRLNQLNIDGCTFTMVAKTKSPLNHSWILANTTSVSVTPVQARGILTIRDAAVRGDASFVNVENFAPMGMELTQCWVATPRTIFLFGGLPVDSSPSDIELDIHQCTMIGGNGLVKSTGSEKRPYGHLIIQANRSILATVGDAALIQHYGQVQWSSGEVPLYFDGDRNQFSAKKIWEIANDARFLDRDYTLKQSIDQSTWFRQTNYTDRQAIMVDPYDGFAPLVDRVELPDWTAYPNTVADPDAESDSIGASAANIPVFPRMAN